MIPTDWMSLQTEAVARLASTRPLMPTAEQERVKRQELRWNILMEEWDAEALSWIGKHVQADRLSTWGPPDTSINALASNARQLTTPGLYGSQPRVGNPKGDGSMLTDPDGLLAASGFWTKQQHVQYMAVGMGDAVVCDDLDSGGLAHRLVEPHCLVVETAFGRPDVVIRLYELRVRWHAQLGGAVWTWDMFSMMPGEEPQFAILLSDGKPATNMWIEGAPPEGLTGAAYTWRDPDLGGEPFIPYTVYRAVDTGFTWNTQHMRGAVMGTLNGAKVETFIGRAALDATGSCAIGVDIEFGGVDTRTESGAPGGPQVRTVQLSPGAFMSARSVAEAKNPMITQIGPGANLPILTDYATLQQNRLAVAAGLSPTDITRTGGNPTSGAALAISDAGRRRFSSRVAPLFRRADIERLRKIASMLKNVGIYKGPTAGWTVKYPEIELSPEERAAVREDTDWQVSKGYLTDTEAYQRYNPGTSAEDAREAIIAARVEAATIDHEVAKRLEALGISPEPEAGDEEAPSTGEE